MRMAFTIAMRATPTSAKTASPKCGDSTGTEDEDKQLHPKASEMFCQTIRRVCLPA